MKKRTNVVLDKELLEAAQRATGLKTKKAVIEEALRRLVEAASRYEGRSFMDDWKDVLDEATDGE